MHVEIAVKRGSQDEGFQLFAPMDTTDRQFKAVLRYVKKALENSEAHTITIKKYGQKNTGTDSVTASEVEG